MLHFRIAAFRGRDPDNPSDRKHPSNGRFCQRMEINGGGTIAPAITSHYFKAGVRDFLFALAIPHCCLIVEYD